ncbi:hypothetical protein ACFFX1_29690 [Dactylosporangium sucinum]|uniref:DUF1877 family protein n=1 Tax=Dactylosporangium sucinum TaxID=1424081 RepID=A0A917X771_9ACTN|nr:hypothetical protein [Dactylosporangium sucinum]GGM85642.1 hypothetical protein GCM10007977_104320 [Dactylosporangium sucinum]
MSSIASLYLVETSDLPAIVSAAGAGRARAPVHRFARELDEEYRWSGHVMLNVLENLEALSVLLESPGLRAASEAVNEDYDNTTLIASDAKAFLDRLDPARYEPGALLAGPIELGLDDEEARYAMEETLSLLRDTIARLSDDEVLLLHIG